MGTFRHQHLTTLAFTAAAFGVPSIAEAAPCQVTNTVDSAATPNTLRWCVGRTNAAVDHEIEIAVPGTYLLDTPLDFYESARLTALAAVTIAPSAAFGGTSLIQTHPGCVHTCPLGVKMIAVNLDGNGVAGPRAIHVGPQTDVTLGDVIITGFDSTGDGGGVFVDDAAFTALGGHLGGIMEISQCTAPNGGGVAVHNGVVNLLSATVDDNTATGDGGGVYIDPQSTTASAYIQNSTVNINGATDGAGIHADGPFVLLDNTEVSGNVATGFGGGIYGNADALDAILMDNQATLDGGAAYVTGSVGFRRTWVTNNIARFGGGFFVTATGGVSSHQTTLDYNTATVATGGGMHVDGGTAALLNSTLAFNSAQTGAAGIHVASGSATLEHVSMGDQAPALFVGAFATVDLRSTVLAGGGPMCSGTGTLNVTTSASEDLSCPGALGGVAPPLNTYHTQFPQPAYSPNLGILGGWANCYSNVDQIGVARPAVDCTVGAVEDEI